MNHEQMAKDALNKPNFGPSDFAMVSRFVERTDWQVVRDRLNEGDRPVRLLHGMLGVAGESGELVDALKKNIYYGKDLDVANVVEECGDLLWYIWEILEELGFSIQDAMSVNSSKLMKRYDGGFTETKATDRNLDQEREILDAGTTR